MSAPLRVSRDGRVATVTLDRAPLNIIDPALAAALEETFTALAREEDLQLVLLEGAGERAFSAGVSVEDHLPEKIEPMLKTFHRAVLALRDLPAVTLAVARGHCLGGGMELATACDLVLAGEGATFGVPEIRLGCFPPVAAALYPRLLGGGRALELLLTGRVFPAAEAADLGLVTWSVADADLPRRRDEIVAELTARSAPVCRLVKRAVAHGRRLPFHDALAACERLYLEELTALDDMSEGLRAFLEKRPPAWRHR